MGLEGQVHPENTVAQQNEAHGADGGENEIRQLLHNGQGIVGGEGGNGQQKAGSEGVEPLGPAFKFRLLPSQRILDRKSVV